MAKKREIFSSLTYSCMDEERRRGGCELDVLTEVDVLVASADRGQRKDTAAH